MNTPKEISELVIGCKLGDREAMRRLVTRFQHPVYGFAMKRLSDHHDAQEAMQETFLAAFRASEYTNAACTQFWLEQLAGYESMHPRTALDQAKNSLQVGELLNALYHQLWHGVIQMDWQRPFI